MNANLNEKIEPWMFRVSGEFFALIVCLILLTILGIWFYSINIYLFLFIGVGGLLYVKLSQAQYLGNAIRIHNDQFPHLFQIFKKQAIRLGIKKANLYITQDPSLNAFSIGIGTGTVILTSALVEQLSEKELAFVIGHELGHIKAGHTIISSLVNPLGTGNPFSGFIFGFWNRKTEYSADRSGLILVKDIDIALAALIKLSIGNTLYKELNVQGYIAQLKKANGGLLSFSELLVDHPFITNRVKKLMMFWRESFTIT